VQSGFWQEHSALVTVTRPFVTSRCDLRHWRFRPIEPNVDRGGETWCPVVLMAQGIAQLVSGVPLTTGEIVTKMVTFAALTVVASGLLARMARVGATELVTNLRSR
jgi:hypothetical protein